MFFIKPYRIVAWLLLCVSWSFTTAHAELPNSADRPFWTQKTCYRMDDIVFGVGLSIGQRSLEKARKESFRAALWEISNYAQIKDTTLLLVETQMTYEEQRPDGAYSVWRLVKTPLAQIIKAKELMAQNSADTQKHVTRIRKLEHENREDLADEIRRALLEGEDVNRTWSPPTPVDKTFPTGWIKSVKDTYRTDETIDLSIRANDNHALKTLVFSIKHSSIKKRWSINGNTFERRISFPAAVLSTGKQVYSITITDAAGNTALKQGVFRIIDLHDELYDILSGD